MLVALMTAFTFTSCEDVPAPYDIRTAGAPQQQGHRGSEVTEPIHYIIYKTNKKIIPK